MKSNTETIIKAMRILSAEIHSDDGVANAAIAESADRLDELQQLNDELMAQVEQLRQQNNELEIMQPSYNLIRNAFYDGACWFDGTINNGTLALDKAANVYANEKLAELTPAQCLAEVKVEAVVDAVNAHPDKIAYIEHYGQTRSRGDCWDLWLSSSDLIQYANQIRQQAKGE